MWQNETSPGPLIERARCGDEIARGELLELYRNYLRLVARSMVGTALRGQLEHSDLVQETFLKAHRDFKQFAGESERELVAWLRQILVRSLANQVKHNRRQARNDQRQESLEQLLEQSNLQAKVAIGRIPRRLARSPATASGPCYWLMRSIDFPSTIARRSSSVLWSTSHSRRSPSGWDARPARSACSGPVRSSD